MLRTIIALALLVTGSAAANAADSAERRAEFDWTQWQSLPLLDDGRIKPLDTFADEVVTLVTARSKWTDPRTDITYRAPELLYLWITSGEEWLSKPIIRAEFRPLRQLLKDGGAEIPVEGTYVSVNDILDWNKSHETGAPVYRSKDLEKRLEQLNRAARQQRSAETVGETSDDRALNGKVAELFEHVQAFLAVREARNMDVVPGIDPRVLTEQRNADDQLKAWVSLGALLRPDEWQNERDVTVAAIMAGTPAELLEALLMREMYPPEHLAQLAQAQSFKGELQSVIREVKPALDATRAAYDAGDAAKFDSEMQTFARTLRRLAEAMEEARPKMTPPERGSIDFGQFSEPLWQRFEPLELDADQMSLSSYPALGASDRELTYNRYQPFRSAWIFFLVAAVIVVFSMMVKFQRTALTVGILASLGAIAYSTWGFALRIAISGRPPVTNMYETVVWVSYVVAVLGVWFCILPYLWPGLRWGWRLAGIPLRVRRNAAGRLAGVEIDRLAREDQTRTLAGAHLPIQIATTVVRLAAFGGLFWFLTQSSTTFRIIDPLPPFLASLSPLEFAPTSIGTVGTWCVGIATVLLSAWYVPRAALALVLGVLLVIPESRREGPKLWEQTVARRYFLLGALPVACFGMMLAHFVGMYNEDVLNPRIGSIAAVLRNNYWLTIHVLTIVSSYAAGALAWGLGNLAMLYYLFGRYRSESAAAVAIDDEAGPVFDRDAARKADSLGARLGKAAGALKPGAFSQTMKAGLRDFGKGDEHLDAATVRPPRETATLASFGYKAMQIAVLLLAAGTILGGLWADVSWGRFWDWDPKEVWALISLLVYLVVLHGRFAGWVGTFGTNVGSVACFSAILMSWYGVNFVLPQIHGWLNGTGQATEVGLHSYATGAGGLEYVVGAVVLNALLVVFAWGRYAVETMDLASKTPATPAKAEPVTAQG